jgi:hypothetical protein
MLSNRLYKIIWASDVCKSEYVGLSSKATPIYHIDIGYESFFSTGLHLFVEDVYEDPLPARLTVAEYSHCHRLKDGDLGCNIWVNEACADFELIERLHYGFFSF